MSTCRDVRDLLLEADPRELAGDGSSAVAEHVRSCGACSAVARAILEDTAALDGYLAGAAPAPDVEAILTEAGALEPKPESRPDSRVIPFPGWRRWSALAVAAAAAGLLFLPGDPPVQVADRPSPEGRPLVEAPAGRNVAVLPTANPDITVLWFF